MSNNNFQYLLAWDIENYFLPNVKYFLEFNNFFEAQKENWKNFNLLSRYQSGYFAYLIPFAYLSNFIGSNLYLSMQFSTLLIACFSGVLVNKLILLNGISRNEAYKFTLIIFLCSVVFFYSTQLLRDIQVMFFYLLAIYFTFKSDFSFKNLLKIIAIILISCTLRVETGLFLAITIPIYLYLTVQKGKKRDLALLSSILVFLIFVFVIGVKFNEIMQLLQNNSEYYLESDKGTGVIGLLQSIPVLGSVLAIIYNAIQPFPFWLKLSNAFDINRPEMYNIMVFPLAIASFFNFIVLVFISYFIINNKVRDKVLIEIKKPLILNIYAGLLYLYIQATVIDQRRLMAYYIIFYILFFIILRTLSLKDRKNILLISCILYFSLQFIAFIIKAV
ncbi:hypothetical protein HXZ75_10025 [Acinetobacter indicus]|nr:hypothetical protein [Acinetobacter indicus]